MGKTTNNIHYKRPSYPLLLCVTLLQVCGNLRTSATVVLQTYILLILPVRASVSNYIWPPSLDLVGVHVFLLAECIVILLNHS